MIAAVHPRTALALVIVAAPLLVAGLVTPPAARAATVTCPPHQLLSDELARSASVFIGTVRETFAVEGVRGARLEVEEVWRGPLLAPIVHVTLEDAAGAPRIELRQGIRYLVAAEPTTPEGAEADTGDRPVTELLIRPCSVTRSVTAEIGALRPSDARAVGHLPTAPGEADVRWPAAGAAIWLWLLAAALLLIGGGLATARLRGVGIPVAAPVGTAAAAVLVIGAATVLALNGDSGSGSLPTPAPSPATSALPATPSAAPAAAPTLVVRLEIESDVGLLAVTSIHADGRLIATGTGTPPRLGVQRLSEAGLDLVREAVAATALLGEDAALEAEYLPEPLDDQPAGRGGFSETLTVGRSGEAAMARWTPVPAGQEHLFAPAPEIDRLEALARQLLEPGQWLPGSAWADPEPRPYEASGFRVTLTGLPFGAAQPAIAMHDLAWPLATPVADLVPARDMTGRPVRCAALSRRQAAELLGSIGEWQGRQSLSLSAVRTEVVVDDSAASVSYRLTLEPLLPDESACAVAAPVADGDLVSGAIALVRVDRLRIRTEPGTSGEAVDAFTAGELVAVVAGPLAADGMEWFEVRQGPSGRGGYVSSGPPDGHPWLVPVSNGAIGFSLDDGSGTRQSLGRVNADGSGLATLVDGSGIAWSPDGTRFAFSAPPTGTSSTWSLGIANPDGSGLRMLGEGDYPVWSPDGSMLTAGVEGGLAVMRADGSQRRILVPDASPWAVAWSPDSAMIAFMRPGPVERGGEGVVPIPEALWLVEVATGHETRLTEDELLDGTHAPAWSPDGTRIAYAARRIIDADGTNEQRLEPGVSFGDTPWSPGGTELVLVADGGRDGARIEIMDVATGARRTVVSGDVLGQVVWSPDGRRLAYGDAAADFSSWAVRVVDALGGEPLEVGPRLGQQPAWQPLVSHPLD